MSQELRQSIRRMVSVPTQVIEAEVTAVDKDADTCTLEPVNGDATMVNVRLRSIIDNADAGLRIYPVIGSIVLAGIIANDDNRAFVLATSDIESISMDGPNGFQLRLKNDGTLELNGGTLGGLVIVENLVDNLNRLENKLNDLVSKYNSHNHVETGGVTGPPPAPETPISPLTVVADVENPKVKQ